MAGILPVLIPLEKAIGRMEGFGANATNRPTRLNNPGDLEFHQWEVAYGATLETPRPHEKARFAKFPTPEQGFTALRALLLSHYGNYSVAELIEAYAPPSENPTERYITDVCAWVGCTRNILVRTLTQAV